MPKLTQRQQDIWKILEEWREMSLQDLLRLGETTSETIRRLEEKGLLRIAPGSMNGIPTAVSKSCRRNRSN